MFTNVIYIVIFYYATLSALNHADFYYSNEITAILVMIWAVILYYINKNKGE